jgi:hypothetical protein
MGWAAPFESFVAVSNGFVASSDSHEIPGSRKSRPKHDDYCVLLLRIRPPRLSIYESSFRAEGGRSKRSGTYRAGPLEHRRCSHNLAASVICNAVPKCAPCDFAGKTRSEPPPQDSALSTFNSALKVSPPLAKPSHPPRSSTTTKSSNHSRIVSAVLFSPKFDIIRRAENIPASNLTTSRRAGFHPNSVEPLLAL